MKTHEIISYKCPIKMPSIIKYSTNALSNYFIGLHYHVPNICHPRCVGAGSAAGDTGHDMGHSRVIQFPSPTSLVKYLGGALTDFHMFIGFYSHSLIRFQLECYLVSISCNCNFNN